MQQKATYVEFSDGEVRLWLEQGESVMIKAVTNFGDPVELSVDEAKALSEALLQLIHEIEHS